MLKGHVLWSPNRSRRWTPGRRHHGGMVRMHPRVAVGGRCRMRMSNCVMLGDRRGRHGTHPRSARGEVRSGGRRGSGGGVLV